MHKNKRRFVLMFDVDGMPDEDLFVLYGTPESIQEQTRAAMARAEKYPFEETPPEVIGEIEINPTEELSKQLDDAFKWRRTDTEQNLFDVFTAFAQWINTMDPEIKKRREAVRENSRMLFERTVLSAQRQATRKPVSTPQPSLPACGDASSG